MEQWRLNKISTEVAREDLINSRDNRARGYVQFLEWRDSVQRRALYARMTDDILRQQQALCRPFHHAPQIDKWLSQYNASLAFRFRTLLFSGPSQSGKTQKACSLFGFTSTLVLNCQGLGDHLPSMQHLDRTVHQCVVMDEVSERQVLANKVFFQAGPRAAELGQSACNQFAYSVFCYKLPIICCSNTFKLTRAQGLSEEDAQWLEANVIEVPVPVSGRWWIAEEEDGLEDA